MRKFMIAALALAFATSTAAFAQDKAGDKSGAAAATSGDTMSKDTMKKTTKKKKSAKKTGDDTMTKQ